MNKLLLRQIKKFFGDEQKIPISFASFIQVINNTYDGFDEDRSLMERSMDLSSQELIEVNQQIRKEAETQKAILSDLRAATQALRPKAGSSQQWLTSRDEVLYLANSLSKLIEEQKKHEQEIIASKEKTEQERAKAEAILKSIGDGVFAVDLQANIILMNSIAEELSGYSFEEARGRNYKEIFHLVREKEPDVLYPSFVEEVVRTGKIKKLANHTLLIRKDKTKLPISDSAAPIKDEKGSILGCIVVVRDASRERALEQAKDDFISIAAHQLRTPLGSMRWNLEMLIRQAELSVKSKAKVGRIYGSNMRMISLVNNLLNVSRIDQGRVSDTPEHTNVFEIIQAEITDMEEALAERHITIEQQLENQNAAILAIDKRRFREVIQNLLSNAVKYNKEGGTVKVLGAQVGNQIEISITDEGMGIPQKDQSRVFSKFYRAENAARSDTTGSGLGLFVVRSYIEGWGGSVNFTSREGEGTTFYVRLPLEIKYIPKPEDLSSSHAEGVAPVVSQ